MVEVSLDSLLPVMRHWDGTVDGKWGGIRSEVGLEGLSCHGLQWLMGTDIEGTGCKMLTDPCFKLVTIFGYWWIWNTVWMARWLFPQEASAWSFVGLL